METHKYVVGETVRFIRAARVGFPKSPSGDFRVVSLLPEYQGHRQYRLESTSDGHQRVAADFELAGYES